MSALQYAVEILKIEHIIICGHYNCGGIRAALEGIPQKLVNHWLENIKQLIQENETGLNELTHEEKYQRLCELNVIQQVHNLCLTDIINNAWESNRNISVYGLIYSPHNGSLKNLDVTLNSREAFESYFGDE